MKTTATEITLTIHDIHESIDSTIAAACEKSDYLATGVIGPSFACSGPGSGWQKNYDASDYAARALGDDYGALGYIDADDGRLATLEDGEVVWSEDSVVTLIAPSAEEIDSDRDTAALMAAAIASGHCVAQSGDDWQEVEDLIEYTQADALRLIDGTVVRHSVVYTDDGTGRWYVGPVDDLIALRKLMADPDGDVARDAYSHWCASTSHDEYPTEDEANQAAS